MSAILVIPLTIFIISYILQFAIAVAFLIDDEFKTRKQFFRFLIPFFFIPRFFISVRNSWKTLK